MEIVWLLKLAGLHRGMSHLLELTVASVALCCCLLGGPLYPSQ